LTTTSRSRPSRSIVSVTGAVAEDERDVIDRAQAIAGLELAVRVERLDDAGDRGVLRIVDAAARVHDQREHDRGQVIRGGAGEDRQEALPRRAVRIGVDVLGVDLLGDVHAADLDEAAERDRRELEDRAGLLRDLLHDAGPEADAEALDAHVAPAGHEVVTALVDDDQEADGQDREDDGQCREHAPRL
jgi:hypothetical protein